jgi:hypothetical protein
VSIDATGKTTGGCQTTLADYLPGAFNLAISIAAVMAFVMLTYGGVLYMTSDAIGNKSKGKEYIENALWGLLLVISSYLILNTINPQMLHFTLTLNPPNTQATAVVIDNNAIIAASQTGPVTAAGILTTDAQLAADSIIRATMAAEQVGVNNPPCTPSRTLNCTDLNGLPASMATSLGQLQQNVCSAANAASSGGPGCIASCVNNVPANCAVTVTGGTESYLHNGGTTHTPGSATVDMAPTGNLNAYLGQSNPANGTVVQKSGMTFHYETLGANAANTGAHWHVTQP